MTPENDADTPLLEIEGLALGGRGVARPADQPVWLVAGGLPGDRVTARATRRRARVVEGSVTAVVEPSAERRPVPCPVQGRCGGCPWMALDHAAQLGWKRRLVADALGRLGGLEVAVDEAVAGERLLGYRNKIELVVVARPGGGLQPAMHGAGGERTVPVDACAVQHPDADALLASLARELERVETERVDPSWRIGLRRSDTDGELLLVVRDAGRPLPGLAALAERLAQAHPALVGTVRLVGRVGSRGGAKTHVVRGRGWLRERIDGVPHRVPAASFLQVNGEMGQRLVSLVVDRVGDLAGRIAVDLYGGLGVHGLAMARRGARVVVCEADVDAVRAGRDSARRAGIENVRYVHADAGRWIESAGPLDVVVANPPRRGFDRRVRAGLAACRARRLVVVSCDPGTLARDLASLAGSGWCVRQVTPVDLFPHTAHVETVVRLDRPAAG